MLQETAMVIMANMLPTMEQIGAIPLGISLNLNPVYVYVISVLTNSMMFFPVFFFMTFFYEKFFSKVKIFNKYLEHARKKGKPYIEKYGVLGLTLFISLPSPFTGTYTASMVSWIMGLDWKKSFLAILMGSAIGGLIILGTTLGFLEAIKIIFSV